MSNFLFACWYPPPPPKLGISPLKYLLLLNSRTAWMNYASKNYTIHNKHQSHYVIINSNERTSERLIYLTSCSEYFPVLPMRIVEDFQDKLEFSLHSDVCTKTKRKPCFASLYNYLSIITNPSAKMMGLTTSFQVLKAK